MVAHDVKCPEFNCYSVIIQLSPDTDLNFPFDVWPNVPNGLVTCPLVGNGNGVVSSGLVNSSGLLTLADNRDNGHARNDDDNDSGSHCPISLVLGRVF